MPTITTIKTIEPIIPVHAEQFLTKDEARILTVARLPSNKEKQAIRFQLTAYSFAEDLEDIHAGCSDISINSDTVIKCIIIRCNDIGNIYWFVWVYDN